MDDIAGVWPPEGSDTEHKEEHLECIEIIVQHKCILGLNSISTHLVSNMLHYISS